MPSRPWTTDDLCVDPLTAARRLLGSDLIAVDDDDDGPVRIRIVEVEAYGGPPAGPHPDPAAHSYPGPTVRNAVMFGPPGHLYVYRSYGIHLCMNITCGPDGHAGAVLLRAGEIVDGDDVVRRRRAPVVSRDRWAMGPGNLGSAAGVRLDDNGSDLLSPVSRIRLEGSPETVDGPVGAGPRVGITVATGRPWRLWLSGSPAVSTFRPGSARVRRNRLAAAADDGEGSDW